MVQKDKKTRITPNVLPEVSQKSILNSCFVLECVSVEWK